MTAPEELEEKPNRSRDICSQLFIYKTKLPWGSR